MKKKTNLNDIFKIIKENDSFLITAHVSPDGDAIGSEIALYIILKKLKKKAAIVNQDKIPKIYKFLTGSDNLSYYFRKNDIDLNFIDVIIALDSSNAKRIGELYKQIDTKKTIINIDHHCSNEIYGTYNYIDTLASSTGEIIYDLIECIDLDLLDKDIATCLFVAIMTDTGSFRYSNTSEKTFRIASKLMSTGINPHIISNNVYNQKTYSELILLGEVLLTLETNDSNYVSWVTVSRDMLERSNAIDENTEGIIDVVTSLENTEISILFRETVDNNVKVSFRSKGNFDVNNFALKFNGGGHPNAAGCMCKGKIKNIKNKILSELFEKLK
ncbi:MAG: bifunctional oligoribonuclease/PAP phosphatase NrnA [Candidatus Caldatribacteriota bacterium]|nr:bifunctional oligoribonuclease/PAP phosphatase NrnA [Candidatus Caldatribacteriota bacterium]